MALYNLAAEAEDYQNDSKTVAYPTRIVYSNKIHYLNDHHMKKIYAILFILFLLTGIGKTHAQHFRKPPGKIKGKSPADKTSKLRTTAVKKLPQKAQNYYWIDSEDTWIETGYSEYTYDAQGNLIKKLEFNPLGNSTNLNIYSYDSYARQTSRISQYYLFNWEEQANQWINSQKETQAYDANGNVIETIFYTWQANQWKIQWAYKEPHTYDSQNRLVELIYQEYDTDEEQWFSNWKTAFEYSGNNQAPNTIADYEYDNNGWIKTSEFTDIVWRNFDNSILIDEDPISHIVSCNVHDYNEGITGRISTTVTENTTVFLTEIYQEEEWIYWSRSTSTVREDGSTVTTYEEFEDSEWEYIDRYTEYTDPKGEYAGYKSEAYESGEWLVNYSDLITNIYNDNDEKIETITERDSPGSPVYKERKVFSDFITIDHVTGASSSIAFISLKAYPNPATDIISFKNIPAGSELSIATTGNHIVLSKQVTETSARITVANLQPGIYFATIRSASGETKTLKFIKQ